MLIVANWKAYVEDQDRAKKLFAVSKKLVRQTDCSIVLAPPAPFLSGMAAANKTRIAFAAQDVSATSGGAQTGEATARMYAASGASYAIIGHSERRSSGDTNAVVVEKLTHALACSLTPVLCVGEKERDREGQYLAFVREEITSAFAPLTVKERAKVIIAYEPVWAIGKSTDHAINPNDLTEMVLYIRKVLAELLPGKSSRRMLVLYGGSVDPENIRDLAHTSSVDGFLIGRASTDEASFVALVKQLS